LQAFSIQVPFKRILASFAGGIFFSSLLPSTIGGDFVRSFDLAMHTKKAKEVVATVILDRLSGCIGLLIVVIFALIFGWRYAQDNIILLPISIIASILILLLLVLFNNFVYSRVNSFLNSPRAGKIRGTLAQLHDEIYRFRDDKKTLVYNLSLSVLIQLGSPLSFYITSRALHQEVNVAYFFIFLPIIGAITLIPISIGGLGLRENMTVIFFKKAGMVTDLAATMSILNSLFILILAGFGGLIYVFTIHRRRIQPAATSAGISHK